MTNIKKPILPKTKLYEMCVWQQGLSFHCEGHQLKHYKELTEKKRNVGNGIGIGAALGVAFGAAYGYKSGSISQSIALGLAIGVALGAIFDFVIKKY